ncbi:MAG: 50S ribosomal protein L21 [Pseudomonadota bacterium]|nr:50S ribosomal protein L21 [Pseudomonadota bacterium]
MYAVIRTGGKQYRVAKDDKIIVEKLAGELGSMVELSDVLLIGGDKEKLIVGSPNIDKAAVFAEVIEQSRSSKVIVFKKNRRKNYRRTRGHRQEQTVLKIVDVSRSGVKPKKSASKTTEKTSDKSKTTNKKSVKKVEVGNTVKGKSTEKKVEKTKPTVKGKSAGMKKGKADSSKKSKSVEKKTVKAKPKTKE